MRKLLFFILLSTCIFCTGCSVSTTQPDSSMIDTNPSTSEADSAEDGSVVVCEIAGGEPIAWGTETEPLAFSPKESDWKLLNAPDNRVLWDATILGDKIILCLSVVPEDANAQMSTEMELGVLDPASGTYTSLGITPHQYSDLHSAFPIGDQYFAMTKSAYDEDGILYGDLLIYNAGTGTLQTADSFARTEDTAQHAAAVGEQGVVYWFTEHETKDTVVRYYDFAKGTASELWRQKKADAGGLSPTAIAYDGTDVLLLMQPAAGSSAQNTGTQLYRLALDGSLLKSETLPLERFIGRDTLTVEHFSIHGDYYYIQIKQGSHKLLFKREENRFTQIDMTDPALISLHNSASADLLPFSAFPRNDSELLYMRLDLTAETVASYTIDIAAAEHNYMQILGKNAILAIRSDAATLSLEGASYYYKPLS